MAEAAPATAEEAPATAEEAPATAEEAPCMVEVAPALGRPDSPEPMVLERQSLLAVRQEQLYRTAESRFPLHRLLVVARLSRGVAAEEVAAGANIEQRQGFNCTCKTPEVLYVWGFQSNAFVFLLKNNNIICESVACGSREYRADHTSLTCWNYCYKPFDKLPVFLLKQGYHRELFENALEDHSGEQVSGLLLLYSSYIFHVVESCSSTIHLIIQDLASLQNQGRRMEFTLFPLSALLQEIKVLVVAHNIPTRLFPDWYVATATSPVTGPRGLTQPQSAAEVVAECLTLLLKAAACIQSFEDDTEDMNESVHTLAPELLIPVETINYLHNAEECASPEDFLRIYLSPSQPALDSETNEPSSQRLTSYKSPENDRVTFGVHRKQSYSQT
ncbi:LOW QUALITY PROTEIN: testis-expressed protein 47 [Phalacrocorax carbo]|uniref:LOW QUALITY PROTEIN: testis-expressed protein 47 n=1 Tax=Phalacrocorax carbo TaxID=9209 RepID=UPI0031195A9D